MKKVLIATGLLAIATVTQSFCGFYVAKANTKLFNKQSEVILVRQGNKTTVTMSNDFQGNAKDFAMVVPVPTVLKEKDIKVVKKDIFSKLNEYSEPRLVEYHDENPCNPIMYEMLEDAVMVRGMNSVSKSRRNKKAEKLGVKVEAEYKVGEYDILILSAKESTGLKTWLTQNNYKIPAKAEEVLDPYIKNNLKFFVVKVDVKEMERLGRKELSPIQISYDSKQFMLPIRLGMANANGTQDLVIYAFTQTGRVETTNYRTAKIPTDKEVPVFVKERFGQFYADLFTKQYEKKNKKAVFLEYSWDLSSENYQKCDPCSTTPPTFAELKDAGVFFVDYASKSGWQGSDYKGKLHFTRLHVRYDRANFPMDLQFQETPNKESFQGRYVLNHVVTEDLDCESAKSYYNKVLDRREGEMENLENLTDWDVSSYDSYINEFREKLGYAAKVSSTEVKQAGISFYGILSIAIGIFSLGLFFMLKKRIVN